MLEEGPARLARLEASAAVATVLPATAPVSELEAEVSFRAPQTTNVRRNASGFRPKWVSNKKWRKQFSMGREADVSRLFCVIAEGAVQLRQCTQSPSSVGNMVS